MRIAVFSDVHGNLTALEAVLEDIAGQDAIDEVIFAGDLCFNGPRPERCVDLIRANDEAISCIHGNTDKFIDGMPLLSDDIDEEERRRWEHVNDVVSWTREKLPAMDRAWLRELPFHRRISPSVNPHDDLFVVHANPKDVDQAIYGPSKQQEQLYGEVRQDDSALHTLLDDLVTGMLVMGHLHVPFVREWEDLTLVNVGSVSLPGDGDPRAKYAIFSWNGDGWDVEHRYVPYDIQAEIEAYHREQPPGWEKMIAHWQELVDKVAD